jgi:hypothetical protein
MAPPPRVIGHDRVFHAASICVSDPAGDFFFPPQAVVTMHNTPTPAKTKDSQQHGTGARVLGIFAALAIGLQCDLTFPDRTVQPKSSASQNAGPSQGSPIFMPRARLTAARSEHYDAHNRIESVWNQ